MLTRPRPRTASRGGGGVRAGVRAALSAHGAAAPPTRPTRRSERLAAPSGLTGAARHVSQGLFELRKDAITGWWVATIVDRTFERERFALPRRRSRTAATASTAGSRRATGSGCAPSRTSRSASRAPRRRPRAGRAGRAGHDRDARAAGAWQDGRRAAGRAPAAPRRGQRRHRGPARRCRDEIMARAVGRADQYLQVVQNWGAQAGARTNHLCFDLYDLPQIPHRIAEELGGAARFLIREGECPYCRLVRDEVRRPGRLLYADAHAVAFAPRPAARRSRCGSSRAATTPTSRAPPTPTSPAPGRPCARSSAGSPGASTARRTTSSCTPRRSRSRSTRRTTGTGRSIPGCARSRAWSWVPACRSTRSRRRTPSRSCRTGGRRPGRRSTRRR